MYGPDAIERYMQPGVKQQAHAYGLAYDAYRGVVEGRCQSIVISGESGAGKTETSKVVLSFLTVLAGKTSNREFERRVLVSAPLLEAFGNARTMHNHNSSRCTAYHNSQAAPP